MDMRIVLKIQLASHSLARQCHSVLFQDTKHDARGAYYESHEGDVLFESMSGIHVIN